MNMDQNAKKCDLCSPTDYDRIEFCAVDKENFPLCRNHMITAGIAKYCPMCGRKMEVNHNGN